MNRRVLKYLLVSQFFAFSALGALICQKPVSVGIGAASTFAYAWIAWFSWEDKY